MEVKIQRLRKKNGIIIPHNVLKLLNLKSNDIKQEKDELIINKEKKVNISLAEKFTNYKGKNLAKDFSWDKDIGKELLQLEYL